MAYFSDFCVLLSKARHITGIIDSWVTFLFFYFLNFFLTLIGIYVLSKSLKNIPILHFRNITHHVMNDDSVIHIGIIVKGVGFGHEKSNQLKYQFVTTYRSILKHAKRKNLHFLIMTDPRSVPYLEKIMRKFAERDRCKCIEVSYDFINTHIITRPYIRAINKIRPYFTSNSQQVRIWRYSIPNLKKSVFFLLSCKNV